MPSNDNRNRNAGANARIPSPRQNSLLRLAMEAAAKHHASRKTDPSPLFAAKNAYREAVYRRSTVKGLQRLSADPLAAAELRRRRTAKRLKTAAKLYDANAFLRNTRPRKLRKRGAGVVEVANLNFDNNVAKNGWRVGEIKVGHHWNPKKRKWIPYSTADINKALDADSGEVHGLAQTTYRHIMGAYEILDHAHYVLEYWKKAGVKLRGPVHRQMLEDLEAIRSMLGGSSESYETLLKRYEATLAKYERYGP